MAEKGQGLEVVFRSAAGGERVRTRYAELLNDWPVANEQLRVPTREGETFVIASGPPHGPPVVLLHGTGINSIMWKGDIAALSEHHRVYAVDIIGEPGFSAPRRPPIKGEAHALWLDDVFRELKVARPTLIGASLGAWMALHYATRRPENVARLVLACPGGVGRIHLVFLFTAVPFMALGDWGAKRAMRILLGVDLFRQGAEARAFGEFMMLVFRNFRPRREPLTQFTDEELQRLKMPLLAILGGRDAIFNSADSKRRLEANVPDAEIVYLPEAGHALMDVQESVLDFLRRTAGAAVSQG